MNNGSASLQTDRSILIIDGETTHSHFLAGLLSEHEKSANYFQQRARSCDHALKLLRRQTVSCCLLNFPSKYPDATARVLSFLKSIRRRKLCENIAVIIIAGEGECSARGAVEFIHQGAQDFLVREEITAHRLLSSIDDAIYQCEFQRNLIHLAHYDHLTGLLSRGLFMDRLQHAMNQSIRNETTCSLVYIDVDHFKQINDLYGHDVGDQLLIKVSEQISANCRNTDSAARIGGDEFAVVISSPSTEDANKLTAAVIKKIAADIHLESPDIDISLSVGVAHYPHTASNIDQLMKHADSAMYKAKRAGRKRFVEFSKHQYLQWERTQRLEAMLPEAIQKQALMLSFEPIYDSVNGALVCVKPSVHWSPNRYKVSSAELLAMIARLKLFEAFYEWLVPEALAMLQFLNDEHRSDISLWLEMERLNNEWLLQSLSKAIEGGRLGQNNIVLGISEPVLLKNTLYARRFVKQLKGQGYRFGVTEFSANVDSKALINDLPVDVLQLDHRCIMSLEAHPESRKTLEAAVLFCRRLGLKLAVDRIDNQAIYQAAVKVKCDWVSGEYCPSILSIQPTSAANQHCVANH